MPIHKVKGGGFQWGGRGKVYPTREGAARQARAAYANGYVGKSLVEIRKGLIPKGTIPLRSGGLKTAMSAGWEAGRKNIQPKTAREVYGGFGSAAYSRGKQRTAFRLARSVGRNPKAYAAGAALGTGAVAGGVALNRRKDTTPKAESRRKRDSRAVATGAGGVLAATGLAAGGIPRVKPNLEAWTEAKGAKAKQKPKKYLQAGKGGILGYREHAHQKFIQGEEEGIKNLSEHGRWADVGPHGLHQRGVHQGKAAAEHSVLRNLKTGRKIAHGALGAGLALSVYGAQRKHALVPKDEPVRKRARVVSDDPRRDFTATAAGGATGAGVMYGTSRLLESQGRKHAKQAIADYKGAGRVAPELGQHTVKRGRVPSVRPVTANEHLAHDMTRYAGKSAHEIESAAHLRGSATQHGYVSSVYGKHAKLFRKYGVGAGAAAGLYGAHKIRQHQKRGTLNANKQIVRPHIQKSEPFGYGTIIKSTNLKDYEYLPENIRFDVGEGSIGMRRNPMSALDLFASSRIMAESSARARGERVSSKRLTRRARNEMDFAGARAMLYSPTGRGSVF